MDNCWVRVSYNFWEKLASLNWPWDSSRILSRDSVWPWRPMICPRPQRPPVRWTVQRPGWSLENKVWWMEILSWRRNVFIKPRDMTSSCSSTPSQVKRRSWWSLEGFSEYEENGVKLAKLLYFLVTQTLSLRYLLQQD